MDWLQVVILALLQGFTEFLPISSSAHLILLPLLVDWPDQGLAFDIAVHVGTLLAVLVYFRRDLSRMFRDWLRSLAVGRRVGDSVWVWYLVVGTVPVGLCGLALTAVGSASLRNASVIAATTIFFALLLWWSDRRNRGTRGDGDIGWRDVLIIGAAQALALIPGNLAGRHYHHRRARPGPQARNCREIFFSSVDTRGCPGRHARGAGGVVQPDAGRLGSHVRRNGNILRLCLRHHPFLSQAGGTRGPVSLRGLSARVGRRAARFRCLTSGWHRVSASGGPAKLAIGVHFPLMPDIRRHDALDARGMDAELCKAVVLTSRIHLQ